VAQLVPYRLKVWEYGNVNIPEDVVQQMMRNDLDRVMKEWMCTSKEEMTRETEVRSWDDTIDNVWYRIAM